MPVQFPRQFLTPSGSITISPTSVGGVLSIDSAHSGTGSGLSPPTLTVSSTDAPITTTVIAPPLISVSSNSSSSGTLSTGAIIGIIVGLFAILAAALIIFMTIRFRKRRIQSSRARALSSARKSWSRFQDDRKPAEMQMHETNLAKTESTVGSTAPMGQNSFLSLNLTPAIVLEDLPAWPPGNSTQQPSGSGRTHGAAAHSPTRSTDEPHILNPFTSSTTSSSHSPSSSHESVYSSHAPSLSPAAMSSITQHITQYAHPSSIAPSSSSEYQYPFPTPTDEPSPRKAAEIEKPAAPPRLVRKFSSKYEEESRSRELRAMKDLISALDERATDKGRVPPSAFNLTIDTSNMHEKSRLSMGESLVTPGGHSIHEEDAVLKYDHDGNPYWTHAHSGPSDDRENVSLPSAQLFRAALSPGGAQARDDRQKGKGKGSSIPNPFQD